MRIFFLVLGIMAANVPLAICMADVTTELCDARDDDGDGTIDEGCLRSCDERLLTKNKRVVTRYDNDFTTFGLDRGSVWDGSRVAVVFQDMERDGSSESYFVRFQRFDPSAAPTEDALDIDSIDATELLGDGPVIAWSGTGYGVAWDESGSGSGRIRFAFLNRNGVVEAGPVTISTEGQSVFSPSIAWDGAAFAVAWIRSGDDIYMRRIDSAGLPLTPESCVSCGSSESDLQFLSITATPEQIAYSWAIWAGGVRFARSDLSGGLLGSVLNLVDGEHADNPSLVANGSGFALAWSEDSSLGFGGREIMFQRIDDGGTPLGTAQKIDDDSLDYREHPAVTWTGEEYVVSWLAGPPNDPTFVYSWLPVTRQVAASGLPLGTSIEHQELWLSSRPRLSAVWTGAQLSLLLRYVMGDFGGHNTYLRLGQVRCCRDQDADEHGFCTGDTDDGNPAVYPGATELCDGLDNDLDGSLDEGCDRACEAAAVLDADDLGTQSSAQVALAVDGASARAYVVHEDAAQIGMQLVIDREQPPWIASPAESDEAFSGEPTAAWTGEYLALAFRDDRDGDPELRFTSDDGQGQSIAFDSVLTPPAAGSGEATASWDGATLALGWRQGVPPELHFTQVLKSGARLLDGLVLSSGSAEASPSLATARDPGGGTVLAMLETDPAGFAVTLERRDQFGAVRYPGDDIENEPRTVVAEAVEGRRDIAVVASAEGYFLAWSGPEGPDGQREIVIAVTDFDGEILSGPLAATSHGGAPDQPSLVWTGEEVVLIFRDRRDGDRTRLFRARLSASGTRLGPDRPIGIDRDIGYSEAAWDGWRIRVAWTRSEGAEYEIRVGGLDCAAVAVAGLVRGLRFQDEATLLWEAVETASYDIVSGDLSLLADSGDFSTAVDACEADDHPDTTLAVGSLSLPRFYLVRAIIASAAGSYAPDGITTPLDRDPAIENSPAACP